MEGGREGRGGEGRGGEGGEGRGGEGRGGEGEGRAGQGRAGQGRTGEGRGGKGRRGGEGGEGRGGEGRGGEGRGEGRGGVGSAVTRFAGDRLVYYNSPYLCRCSQTAGRNSCSIVSGDVSNCSYRLTVHPVTSSRLSSATTRVYTFTA